MRSHCAEHATANNKRLSYCHCDSQRPMLDSVMPLAITLLARVNALRIRITIRAEVDAVFAGARCHILVFGVMSVRHRSHIHMPIPFTLKVTLCWQFSHQHLSAASRSSIMVLIASLRDMLASRFSRSVALCDFRPIRRTCQCSEGRDCAAVSIRESQVPPSLTSAFGCSRWASS